MIFADYQLFSNALLLLFLPSFEFPFRIRVWEAVWRSLRTLKYTGEGISAEKWDGVVFVTTTGICDNEIYHYQLNLQENISTRRLTKLPSNPKNGAKFSGTEVALSTFDCIDDLLAEITLFLQKTLILKIPKVAIELAFEHGVLPGSQCENVIVANECDPLPFVTSNIENLKSGLEDYVLKHGNRLDKKCHSCFPSREHLKVGSGIAFCKESHRSTGHVMETVIIISELSEPSSTCFRTFGAKTEVLYFNDFSPCLISQSSLNALTSIDWKSYGLTLKSAIDQDGHALLEWEHLPPNAHIDIVLHSYHKQYPLFLLARQKTQFDRNLVKKAVKQALDDLKEKHAGILLSAHAHYAPDLARTIAGLIMSSNDSDFQGECFSLLGLQSQEIGGEIVGECIKEKIITVIEMNDRKPQRSREAAPFLFEDDCFQEPDFQDEEYEEGEEAYRFL
ncbi:hypothetical protein L1049_006304 [Liquidambar formosana]|uniref:Type 2 DNA topoisomerase 6 subunit B-like n=1 Tax=Liquidambar formosana TaxID=63359 RepID=A0AAP0RGZ3_LIQFO